MLATQMTKGMAKLITNLFIAVSLYLHQLTSIGLLDEKEWTRTRPLPVSSRYGGYEWFIIS